MRLQVTKKVVSFFLLVMAGYASGAAEDIKDCSSLGWNTSEKACRFTKKGFELLVFPLGKIKITSPAGEVREQVILLPENFFIESVAQHPLGDGMLLTFGITDADAGSSIIALFDAQEVQLKWQTEIPAFNLSEPLIEAEAVYVGAIGTVAKIDRDSGKVIWLHDHLYETSAGSFNSFNLPCRDGDFIKFVEEASRKDTGAMEIVVEDTSGEIITRGGELQRPASKP